jgi:hypothetical protein
VEGRILTTERRPKMKRYRLYISTGEERFDKSSLCFMTVWIPIEFDAEGPEKAIALKDIFSEIVRSEADPGIHCKVGRLVEIRMRTRRSSRTRINSRRFTHTKYVEIRVIDTEEYSFNPKRS